MDTLENCPCCESKASVQFQKTDSLGMSIWKSDCTYCIDSSYFVRISKERAIEDWNAYALKNKRRSNMVVN